MRPRPSRRLAIENQVAALRQSIALYRQFIDRAERDSQYADAVQRSRERIRHLRRSASFLLLQPMIGATAAMVVTWLGVEHALNGERLGLALGPAVGFLAGFSEPFFLGTLGRLTELAASNGKDASAGKGAPVAKDASSAEDAGEDALRNKGR